MKARLLSCLAMIAVVVFFSAPTRAQWRATAWTLDLQNDTDMCLLLTAGQDGNVIIDQANVWPHRSQHFDDNHLELKVHAKVYERPDCSGRFLADLHDNVITLRNVLTILKAPDGKYVMHREKHW